MGLFLTPLISIPTLFAVLSSAQFPPRPEGLTILQSKFHPNISISYKEPGICETTPGVRSFSGYVHLPPNTLDDVPHERQNYPINTFFWFFESRKDPQSAPLSIWLNGGPGGSSLMGALSENGPCFVGNDSNSTYLNPWSWNNEVNLLYIDQPNQVGYSYDTLTNITVELLGSEMGGDTKVADFSSGVPAQNHTFLVGTGSSQNSTFTANTTAHAAVALWHFAQTWFEEFPQYKPHDEKISLFTESYGGRYGPTFVDYFLRQNELIANGTLTGPGLHYLHMDTLGIVNGCIDSEEQLRGYIEFAWRNTYGIRAFNESQYYHAKYEFSRPGGLKDQIAECQRLERESDPNDYGEIEEVSKYCQRVNESRDNVTIYQYMANKKYGWYDITHSMADPFPPSYLMGFLNQHWVQAALGVPVNHSVASGAVYEAFTSTGDLAKGGLLEDIGYILDHGVKVAMMYGDRDYACNWLGGEAASLKIPWAQQDEFTEAGYTPLVLSPVWSGGLVRQVGNLSFTRVYQAGHLVPSYQPEAAYEIFMRSLFNKDIATGKLDLLGAHGEAYRTEGPKDTWGSMSDVLPAPEGQCYALDPSKCSEEEQEWLKDGTAVLKDWILMGREEKKAGLVQEEGQNGGQVPLFSPGA